MVVQYLLGSYYSLSKACIYLCYVSRSVKSRTFEVHRFPPTRPIPSLVSPSFPSPFAPTPALCSSSSVCFPFTTGASVNCCSRPIRTRTTSFCVLSPRWLSSRVWNDSFSRCTGVSTKLGSGHDYLYVTVRHMNHCPCWHTNTKTRTRIESRDRTPPNP